MKTIKEKIVAALALLAPTLAFAQNTPPPPIKTMQQLLDFMCTIFGWMFYGLIALSVIMVVVSGYMYVTAGGESEKVGKANKMILYAAIGIGVALLAKAIPLIVGDLLNVTGGASSLTAC